MWASKKLNCNQFVFSTCHITTPSVLLLSEVGICFRNCAMVCFHPASPSAPLPSVRYKLPDRHPVLAPGDIFRRDRRGLCFAGGSGAIRSQIREEVIPVCISGANRRCWLLSATAAADGVLTVRSYSTTAAHVATYAERDTYRCLKASLSAPGRLSRGVPTPAAWQVTLMAAARNACFASPPQLHHNPSASRQRWRTLCKPTSR